MRWGLGVGIVYGDAHAGTGIAPTLVGKRSRLECAAVPNQIQIIDESRHFYEIDVASGPVTPSAQIALLRHNRSQSAKATAAGPVKRSNLRSRGPRLYSRSTDNESTNGPLLSHESTDHKFRAGREHAGERTNCKEHSGDATAVSGSRGFRGIAHDVGRRSSRG
jgi:hypothetical protein